MGPAGASAGERLTAALVAAGCLALLLVAASLRPEVAGHGTHEQLGLPPCGWVVAFDRPCVTCGMTTAFATAAEGRVLSALAIQPLGALLCVGVAAMFWGALHVAGLGSGLHRAASRALLRPRSLWLLALAAALAWAYKWFTWELT